MTRADYAAMADPERNRQFHRRWDEPAAPPPREWRSRPVHDPLPDLGRTLRDDMRRAAA